MQADGALTSLFGPLVGTGPGAGMSLMVLLSGVFGALVVIVGYMIPAVRNVEEILPDFDATATPVPVEAEPAL